MNSIQEKCTGIQAETHLHMNMFSQRSGRSSDIPVMVTYVGTISGLLLLKVFSTGSRVAFFQNEGREEAH